MLHRTCARIDRGKSPRTLSFCKACPEHGRRRGKREAREDVYGSGRTGHRLWSREMGEEVGCAVFF